MGMQVVLAGTAATAANMISDKNHTRPASRFGKGDSAWVEVIFLWQEIKEETMKDILPDSLLKKITWTNINALKKAIKMERPLVAVLIGDVLRKCIDESVELMTVLKMVGSDLHSSKDISNENHLIWLAGPWLDGEYKMPAALRMQAPELVRGHFFEPSIAVNHKERPLFDPGLCSWKRLSSPLRLGVNTCKHNAKLFFSVTAQKDIGRVLPERMSCGSIASEGFDDVEMCFDNCTQQCLSREPFLAVALSTVNMNAETFQTTVSMWKQSLAQRTVGGLDGELHELLFFAAIQLASHSKGIQLCGIMDFIQEVKCYICKAKQEVTLTLNEEALKRLRVKSNEKTRCNINAENIEWYSKQVKTPPAIVTKPARPHWPL